MNRNGSDGLRSGETTARPSQPQGPHQEHHKSAKDDLDSEAAPSLALGWPKTYVPSVHRPWHSQHPSAVDNHYLIFTCHESGIIFPERLDRFEPANVPWFAHWLVCFCVDKTTLTLRDVWMVYKYKYREAIVGIEYLTQQHIIDLYHYLQQGNHPYAFEWDRTQEFEDSVKDLLNVWLSEAWKPWNWQSEEERQRHNAVLNGADF